MQRNIWYNQNVAVQKEKKGKPLPMKVQESLFDLVEEIAAKENRDRGFVARELMVRGIRLYEVDGKLWDGQPYGVGTSQIPEETRATFEDSEEVTVVTRKLKLGDEKNPKRDNSKVSPIRKRQG